MTDRLVHLRAKPGDAKSGARCFAESFANERYEQSKQWPLTDDPSEATCERCVRFYDGERIRTWRRDAERIGLQELAAAATTAGIGVSEARTPRDFNAHFTMRLGEVDYMVTLRAIYPHKRHR